jgi:DNA-binding transcriptional MerR regulator
MIDTNIANISEKKYWTIGEASKYTKTPAYTLRYWESEFKLLCPIRKNSKQRLYRKEDIDLINLIKSLLYEKKYTIEGVKKYLNVSKKKQKSEFHLQYNMNNSKIDEICDDLRQVLELLKRDLS